jgi:hypothetical protein
MTSDDCIRSECDQILCVYELMVVVLRRAPSRVAKCLCSSSSLLLGSASARCLRVAPVTTEGALHARERPDVPLEFRDVYVSQF